MRDVAYIALGSNVGNREVHLATAIAAMNTLPDSRLLAASTVEETPPLGPSGQPPYLNQMVALETALAPRELLRRLQAIERAAGRERSVRWGPRTLDLDIVMMIEQTIDEPDLVVPHPQLDHRDFWQRGIEELERQRG